MEQTTHKQYAWKFIVLAGVFLVVLFGSALLGVTVMPVISSTEESDEEIFSRLPSACSSVWLPTLTSNVRVCEPMVPSISGKFS